MYLVYVKYTIYGSKQQRRFRGEEIIRRSGGYAFAELTEQEKKLKPTLEYSSNISKQYRKVK